MRDVVWFEILCIIGYENMISIEIGKEVIARETVDSGALVERCLSSEILDLGV